MGFLDPQHLSSRQRTIDLTAPVHEPRMVLYKKSKRPDHYSIYYFNFRRAQDANLVFHQRSNDAIVLYDNMLASALDNVMQVKPTTLTKLEATLGDRIDVRISGQLEELYLQNEREAKVFLISIFMRQVMRSPNRSTMVNDLINNYSQKMACYMAFNEKVKKQAEQRKGVDVMETLQNHKKLKEARGFLDSTKRLKYGTIVRRYFEDDQYQMRLHEQGHTIRRGRI